LVNVPHYSRFFTDADPLSDNAYKVQLTENIIYRAAMTAIA
jgi:CO/xanthine dehydrogenase FAD-binding subunit